MKEILKIDKKDKLILYELNQNSRQSVAELARKTRLSRDVVAYRLKELEAKHLVLGYNALIDASKLGFKVYRVFLNLRAIDSDNYNKLVDALKNNSNTFWVGKCDGFIDLVFAVWCQSDLEFYNFHKKILNPFRRFISDQVISTMISYSYLDSSFLIEKREKIRDEIYVWNQEGMNFDEIDAVILNKLSNDARIPLLAIAKELKMDPSAIKYRIRNLEKNRTIKAYKATIDFSLLGRDFYSIKLNMSDLSRLREVKEFIKNNSSVTNFSESLAGFDIEFDMLVLSSQEYFEFIQELKDKFDSISEVKFYRVVEKFKEINMPKV
ncbi:MAG: Lrp/AsnC family transcriptional regulator [Nanoarchaeota archaeon]|nr:Lrp/AsnC family transcriptional regulator [Nanoarchaeota archaeon]